MSTSVTQYKIYCDTESQFVSGWGTTAPTTCYNNNTHTVNVNSVQVISVVADNRVTINQNDVSQTGRFVLETISVPNVAGGTTGSTTHTFDVPMSLHSFNFALNSAETGDLFTIIVNPDMPIGLITANITSGSAVVAVNVAVIGYLTPGLYLTIMDGTNTEGPFKILSKDLVNSTVTLKTALTHNYSSTNTQMLLNYYVIKDMSIVLGTTYTFGGEIISASTVPAGTTASFSFTNNGVSTKTIAVYLTGII